MRNLEPSSLPIDDVLPEVMAAVREQRAAVLRAPTGAGKTTRVPPALLDSGAAGEGRVVMLEPRRVAARAAARRMAAERGGEFGDEVGYHVRFDCRAGPSTRILVVTEGLLVAMLQADPFLEGTSAVVFDEFHERNLSSDLALAMVRQVQREVRPDLAIVVMSATLEPEPVAAFLGGAPAIESAGRQHPVAIEHLERPDPRPLAARVASGVERMLARSAGDVLAFLPGVGEIGRCARLLEPLARGGRLRIVPLYGDLPPAEQDAALRPGDRRRVILSTNVAETSITIEGVSAVVDSGHARVLRFDPATGLDRLELVRVSRASADQRAGRAGRQGPGRCLRLWTLHDERSLQPRETPEIQRVDLAAPVLQLFAWGESDPATFGWFEAPETRALEGSIELLADLGALRRGRLTDLGRAMARLPVHPRLGRLLVAGHAEGILDQAAIAAALLSERDVVHRSLAEGTAVTSVVAASDLVDRLEAVERHAPEGYAETALGPVHGGRARHVRRVGRQLRQLAERHLGPPARAAGGGRGEERLRRALLAAYPDRLARRRRPGSRRGVMVGGRGVRLAETSAVTRAELFLALELDGGRSGERREALVRQASAVEPDWIPPEQLTTVDEVAFDPGRERVAGRRLTRYRDLVISEVEIDPGPAEAERVLAEVAAASLERALGLGERDVAEFLARLRSLAGWMPELELPRFEDEELRALLPALVAGKRSFAELRRTPLLPVLRGALSRRQLEALERHAPSHLDVPSGSRVRLRYEPGGPPVLAVRIQEVFGLTATPAVASGRVPVLLHLLAPNQRPQQVTRDLASFWQNAYPEIRKQLRGRYPRHAWPEDPLRAPPERRPRRRG